MTPAVANLSEDVDDSSSPQSTPPSTPSSGSLTPLKVTIAPCPLRLRTLIPPVNYGTVDLHAVYRSAFPQDDNLDFMKALKICTVLTLVETEPSPGFEGWLTKNNINQYKIKLGKNKNGTIGISTDAMSEAMLYCLNKLNHPVLVHCNQGKHRTGCVIACLRKIQGVDMDEILDEYRTYASPKAREEDIQFIRAFETSKVFDYAKEKGYTRPDIRDIDDLANALLGVARRHDSRGDVMVNLDVDAILPATPVPAMPVPDSVSNTLVPAARVPTIPVAER